MYPMDREVCVVEYALTEDDMVAFANVPFTSTFVFRYSTGALRLFVFLAAVVVFVAVGLFSGSVDRWHDPKFRGWALAVIAAVLIGGLVFERPLLTFILRRRVRAGGYAEMMQQRRLQLSAKGIKSTTRTEESLTRWPDIVRVTASSAGAYLLSSVRHGYVVPRRAFPDAEAFAEFVRTAQKLRRDYG
jgi:YcxB-like protein